MEDLQVPRLQRLSLRRPHSPPVLFYTIVPLLCVVGIGAMLAGGFIDAIPIGGPSIIDLVFLIHSVGFVLSIRWMTTGRQLNGIKLGHFLYSSLIIHGGSLSLFVWLFPELPLSEKTRVYAVAYFNLLPGLFLYSIYIFQKWREWEYALTEHQ